MCFRQFSVVPYGALLRLTEPIGCAQRVFGPVVLINMLPAARVRVLVIDRPLCGADAVRVIEGEDHVRSYSKGDKTIRKWCNICGGHLFTYHQKIRLIDVYPAVLQSYNFQPTVHLCYHKCVAPIRDALTKKGMYGEDVPEHAPDAGMWGGAAAGSAMSPTASTTSSSTASSAPASANRNTNSSMLLRSPQ